MLNIIITNSEAMCASPAEGNALHFDPTRLTPEQIEQFKTLLGIGSSNEQQPSTPVAFDPTTLTEEQVVSLRERVFNLSTGEFLTRDIDALNNLLVESGRASGHFRQVLAQSFVDTAIEGEIQPIATALEELILDFPDKAQAEQNVKLLEVQDPKTFAAIEGILYALSFGVHHAHRIKALEEKVAKLEKLNLLDVTRNLVTTERGKQDFINNIMSNYTHATDNTEYDWSSWKHHLGEPGEEIDTEAANAYAQGALAVMLSKGYV